MAKKKRSLGISPQDRLVGIQAHNKQDLLHGCNEPSKPWYAKDVNQFTRTYCKVCRNPDCIRALGARTPWHDRMSRQVEYLINNPVFSDFEQEEHRSIAEVVWDSLKQKAERMEIANRDMDWEIPGVPTDGINRLQGQDITDDVDDAVKRLARNSGKKEPEIPEQEVEEAPSHFQSEPDPQPEPEDETSVVYETDYPAASKAGTYRVWLQADGLWQCECDGYKHIKKCKHLGDVVPWYNENVRDREDEEEEEEVEPTPVPVAQAPAPQTVPEPAPAPEPPRGPSPTSDPRVRDVRLNTPMPEGGVMLGGEEGPQRDVMRRPIVVPDKDAWEIPDETVVEPGAKVVIKSKK